MYFRMLKRDLKDKKALNITLFIFMLISSVFVMTSAAFLYSKLTGEKKVYEYCNTSDILMTVPQSMSDEEGLIKRVTDWFNARPETAKVARSEVIQITSDFIDFSSEDVKGDIFKGKQLLLCDMPKEYNIPCNMDDERFTVQNGTIAVAQDIQLTYNVGVGDKLLFRTTMGNVYELTIATVCKDPTSCGIPRIFFSDEDFEVLRKEYSVIMDCYAVYLDIPSQGYMSGLQNYGLSAMEDLKKDNVNLYAGRSLMATENSTIATVISFAMAIVGIFMILMVMVTIHFSLKSAIKREEKEIGMMKAIGVYSLSYQTLFAVKYFAFILIGGLLAIPAAIPLSRLLINTFTYHTLNPPKAGIVLLSLAALSVELLVICAFVYNSLRRMNRISVMDTIHGETRGERFRKIPGLFLHRKKRIGVPLFLAASDILGRIKRYLFLILAYTAGVIMILSVIRLKDATIKDDFLYYYSLQGRYDFVMDIQSGYMRKLADKSGSGKGCYELINQNLREHDIPARVEAFNMQSAMTLKLQDNDISCSMFWDGPDTADVCYVEGTPPNLNNEIALPWATAKTYGIGIGDTVLLEYDKYGEDHIASSKVTESYIVTAYFQMMGFSSPFVIMGNTFTGAVPDSVYPYGCRMDCPASEYDGYFRAMDDLYTDEEIEFTHKDGVVDYFLGSYDVMFSLMLAVVIVIVIAVVSLLTVLYENIFIEEETGDVAVLKSMGFNNRPVKQWQFLRIFLLVLGSIVLAVLLMNVAGNRILGALIESLLRLAEFSVVTKAVSNYVAVPAGMMALVALVTLPTLKPIERIQIWKIRED